MPQVILYIATSLDGYIARKDGEIDWLPPVGLIQLTYRKTGRKPWVRV